MSIRHKVVRYKLNDAVLAYTRNMSGHSYSGRGGQRSVQI